MDHPSIQEGPPEHESPPPDQHEELWAKFQKQCLTLRPLKLSNQERLNPHGRDVVDIILGKKARPEQEEDPDAAPEESHANEPGHKQEVSRAK